MGSSGRDSIPIRLAVSFLFRFKVEQILWVLALQRGLGQFPRLGEVLWRLIPPPSSTKEYVR